MPTRVIESRFLANAQRTFLMALGEVEAAIQASMQGRHRRDPPSPESLRVTLQGALDGALTGAEGAGFGPANPALVQCRAVLAILADLRLGALDWVGHEAWVAQPLGDANPSIDGVPTSLLAQAASLARGDLGATEVSSRSSTSISTPTDGAPGVGTIRGPERAALAEVYVLALALLPQVEDGAAGVRRALCDVVRSEHGVPRQRPDPLFPDAYRHTQRHGPIPRLDDPRGWTLVLGATMLALVGATFRSVWPRAIEPASASLRTLLELLTP